MKKGAFVKIPDIGSLAVVVQTGRHMVKLELDGEEFWIERRLVEVVE